jgi:hypothetical protein
MKQILSAAEFDFKGKKSFQIEMAKQMWIVANKKSLYQTWKWK